MDERFATMAARRQHRETVIDALAALLAGDTTGNWVARLAPIGVVVAGVAPLEQALASEQAIHRAMIAAIDTPAGPLRVVGNPIKIAGETATYTAPPLLGEHNARRTGLAPKEEGATP